MGKRGFVEVTCKCSLGGPTDPSGFCGSVLGTDYYKKAVSALKNVFEKSNCHTLDRKDMRAQKDNCGIGTNNDEWRFAVDKMFNVTYWPYIQISNVYTCVSQFFGNSWYNLNLDYAHPLFVFSATVIAVFAISNLTL